MSRTAVVQHLIGAASAFWHPAELYRDFGTSLDVGFQPIGKFGIGFLSVFMLGDRIEVHSESSRHTPVSLRLRGVGRRGEVREAASTGNMGTTVRIYLKAEADHA